MKLLSLFAAIAAALLFVRPACAQDIQAYGFATDFNAQDQIVELNFPAEYDGVSFFIVWHTAQGQFVKKVDARAGQHCYELRNVPEWTGHVDVAAITGPGISGRVRTPTFADELDMMLAPEPVSSGTVNFLDGHTLYAFSLNAWLLLVVLLAGVGVAVVWKKPLAPSMLFGFLVAWGLMDIRNACDHMNIVSRTQKYVAENKGMFPLAGIKVFADRASEFMGPNVWKDDAVGLVQGSFLRYRLAEYPYASDGSRRKPDLWVTQKTGEADTLWQYAGYFLVRRTHP